jgi:hypothetical protein
MAGETWRGLFQAAVEATPGTPVTTATRRLYFNNPDSVLSRIQTPRIHRFATGGRDNVRGITLGSIEAGGRIALPMSYDEIIELLLVGIQGSVTPSTGTWTFLSSGASWVAPQSMSLQWFDGANPWIESGCQVGRYRFSGAKNGANDIACDLFGQNLATATITPAAGSLAQRSPTFLEGWQTSLFIDPTTYGTTAAAMLTNWDITIDNHLGRKYFGNNTQSASGITLGELEVTAQLTIEAAVATIPLAEFANWIATPNVLRRVRVAFLDGSGAVNIDLPGYWTAYDLGQNGDGTRTYQLTLSYTYDVTNSFGLKIAVTNARATAW